MYTDTHAYTHTYRHTHTHIRNKTVHVILTVRIECDVIFVKIIGKKLYSFCA